MAFAPLTALAPGASRMLDRLAPPPETADTTPAPAQPWRLLLLGCGHSEPFTNPNIGTDQPFDPGPPVRLTANVGGDLQPAWTADGYVSDRWRPVSPVTGRLDAFQWQTPVAALPSDRTGAIESSAFEEAMLASPRRAVVLEPPKDVDEEEPAPSPYDSPAPSAAPEALAPAA